MLTTARPDRAYRAIERSLAFPGLPSSDLERFIHRRGTMGELALDDELAQWVCALVAGNRSSRQPDRR